MSRVLLQYLLPLLLPTAIYLVWWFVVGHRRPAANGGVAKLQHGPWFWLIVAGLLMMGAGLAATALTRGYDPKGKYVAPTYEDGRVVPGRVE